MPVVTVDGAELVYVRGAGGARQLGVSATPTFFVCGRRHRDAFDACTLVSALLSASSAS